ncbi:n-6 adenine-specific dna methylases signature [Lucifera butyrica]|uniref:N-6 adenine-specific dna methylases signature n=1 Tax=Lucifera butyrica TaxID=1351585 RepID=A0A498R5Z8_9FIRM|nr:16S rRNA (guanine(966)-N(2))-methyltransferase RsmD [Lucifera butyrica]VBB05672.1 n-6 adenine-specific dna methylases signature [Lucifera butyrica]
MRIITGTAKGVILKGPAGNATRPTADRVKESLFSILGSRIIDASVLDLFAGTGNLGLEALSRGAEKAVFIDQSLQSVALIKENARRTKLADRTEIYKNDVFKAIDKLSQTGRSFDLIFCDPPYNQGLITAVLEKVAFYTILNPEAMLIIEHSRHEMINSELPSFQILRTEKYGETLVSFLLYKSALEG